jgi:hypothetical protein
VGTWGNDFRLQVLTQKKATRFFLTGLGSCHCHVVAGSVQGQPHHERCLICIAYQQKIKKRINFFSSIFPKFYPFSLFLYKSESFHFRLYFHYEISKTAVRQASESDVNKRTNLDPIKNSNARSAFSSTRQ